MSFVWQGKTLEQITRDDYLPIIRDGRGDELLRAFMKRRIAQLEKLEREGRLHTSYDISGL